MSSRKKPSKKVLLEAIKDTGGVVSRISEKIHYSWHATRAAIDNDPEILRAYQDECERVDDIAEHTVISSIAKGDVDSAKWWLKTRRRSKFGDAMDVTTGGEQIQIVEVCIPKDDSG